VRNDFVTGQAGGVALPLYMLTYMREMGITSQTAYSALQFAYRMDNGDYVRLWGMLRDLEATGRKRPTWLGVELVNRAIMGDMMVTTHSGANPSWLQPPINGIDQEIEVPFVQSFAFRRGDRHSIVLFNLHLDQGQAVRLSLDEPPAAQAQMLQLAAASIHDDNEDAENVTIEEWAVNDFGDQYELTLPPHSVTAILWRAEALFEDDFESGTTNAWSVSVP
jgi:hypothetical protein